MHRLSVPGDADPLRLVSVPGGAHPLGVSADRGRLVPVPGGADPVGPCGDRSGGCRYRRVPTRLDSRGTGADGAGTGRCRATVHESAPLRLSPVPGGPEERPCVSRHRSRSPGSGMGFCRYRGRSSHRCQSRHHRLQGADTGLAPVPVSRRA